MFIATNVLRLESPLKERADTFVAFIKVRVVPRQQLFHERTDSAVNDFANKYVKMIRHQHVGSNGHKSWPSVNFSKCFFLQPFILIRFRSISQIKYAGKTSVVCIEHEGLSFLYSTVV